MNSSTFLLASVTAFSLAACTKPNACLKGNVTLEVNKEHVFNSCSKDYEFLAWEYGDGSTVFIGDTGRHIYTERGEYRLTLTAYGEGAYQSDQTYFEVTATRRLLDHITFFPAENDDKFTYWFEFKGSSPGSDSTSFKLAEISDLNQYEYTLSASDTAVLRPEPALIVLKSVRNGVSKTLISQNINFNFNNSNTVVLDSSSNELTFTWKYE